MKIPALLALLFLSPVPALGGEAEDLSSAFRKVARGAGPAVVSISVRKAVPHPAMRFEERLPEGFPFRLPPMPRDFEARGQGSGVVVDAEQGYVLTNRHVVEGAKEVEVHLKDGRRLDGKVLGEDANTDLAVVRIEAKGLTAAALGDSDALEPGDWVVAIGAPFGLEQTVTAGIVSAKGRADVNVIRTPYAEQEFIQTDAAINPGNSGGPLLNLKGEVVGINTAIAGMTGGNVGVGFSVPSNLARRVMGDLVRSGRVVRGWLGVKIQDLTPELSEQFGTGEGVLVGEVMPGTPAEKAGLQEGDVLLAVAGASVKDTRDLRRRIASAPVGEAVELRILRDGKETALPVTLGEQPGEAVAARGRSREDGDLLGMRVEDAEDGEGVVVAGVEPGSPASREGLEPGDRILSAARKEVSSARELREAAKAQEGKGLLLRVRQGEGTRWVVLKP